MTCPICSEPVVKCNEPVVKDRDKTYPFCSSRCRLIDLGKWLDEDYRVPGPPALVESGQEEQ